MELVDRAIIENDFGLRKRFPWTGSNHSAPWTKIVTESDEISFVRSKLGYLVGESALIKRVENPYLWARYVLSYEELNTNTCSSLVEKYVIHATCLSNALNIADVNFDWRRVRRARFGQGVSFAMDASYAKKYASANDVFIIAGIPIGHENVGNYQTKIPYGSFDTTRDGSGKVYVKYHDNDFYPYYIIE